MKMKKFVALALAAVMAVSVLTGCGGSGGVSGSVSTSQVNNLLEDVGSDITVSSDSTLNNAVRNAAREIVSTGSISSFDRSVRNSMGWTAQSIASSILNQILGGLGIVGPSVTFGLTSVVEENQLKTNTGAGGLASYIGANSSKVTAMAPINTPEKYAATLVLAVDGTLGLLSDITDNHIRMTYNVSGTKATAPDGTVYWVFAAQIKMAS
ncbi:hypothetical protein [Faecalibacterium sp. An122]|uniref:hypothetical protein n=1 Tax=Faecalibacterium sp. An122 TaxID=1965551 RepID=UPI000B39F314|nr:hypothetical protein [Faecalibacterium sp. An122]OUQ36137.1 hypothetical protein B5E67_10965 [Faecalibacterium sp. An122]